MKTGDQSKGKIYKSSESSKFVAYITDPMYQGLLTKQICD